MPDLSNSLVFYSGRVNEAERFTGGTIEFEPGYARLELPDGSVYQLQSGDTMVKDGSALTIYTSASLKARRTLAKMRKAS